MYTDRLLEPGFLRSQFAFIGVHSRLKNPAFQAPATRAAQIKKARVNLNRKDDLADLCRKRTMPSSPPGQPPNALANKSEDSGMRRAPLRPARHLSKPNRRKAQALRTPTHASKSWSMGFIG